MKQGGEQEYREKFLGGGAGHTEGNEDDGPPRIELTDEDLEELRKEWENR
jgi:hypothetical protein